MYPFALLDLHLLESTLREEKEEEVCVDQGFVRVDRHSSPSEDIPKCASPILVYGGVSCESSLKRSAIKKGDAS